MLASQGVVGLPLTTLVAAPTPAPAPRSAPAKVPVKAALETLQTPVAPVVVAVPIEQPRSPRAGAPWHRHAQGSPQNLADAPPPPPRAEPIPASRPAPQAPASSAGAVPGSDALRIIREEIGDCRRCKLWQGRTNLVFGVGNPRAELLFVGEGPGADEDMQGEPFVGKAGELLTQMIKAMGYARSDVYICNVVKCRPPNNREPEPDETAACSPFVFQQIQAVAPRVIVTLGKTAAVALFKRKVAITRERGTWGTFENIPVMPTFHPSFLLREPAHKREAWDDLKSVMARLGKPLPERRG